MESLQFSLSTLSDTMKAQFAATLFSLQVICIVKNIRSVNTFQRHYDVKSINAIFIT